MCIPSLRREGSPFFMNTWHLSRGFVLAEHIRRGRADPKPTSFQYKVFECGGTQVKTKLIRAGVFVKELSR